MTPWEQDRNEAERTGALPPGMPHRFHRHFASDVIHRDGGPEFLSEHEVLVARYAIAHPGEFSGQEGPEAP